MVMDKDAEKKTGMGGNSTVENRLSGAVNQQSGGVKLKELPEKIHAGYGTQFIQADRHPYKVPATSRENTCITKDEQNHMLTLSPKKNYKQAYGNFDHTDLRIGGGQKNKENRGGKESKKNTESNDIIKNASMILSVDCLRKFKKARN